MFFELKEIELRNYLPNEVDLHGINTDQLSIMSKDKADTEEYLKSRDSQSNLDVKVTTLTGTNIEEFDLAFTSAFRRHNSIIGITLDYLLSTDEVRSYNVSCNSCEKKLKFCDSLRGQAFNDDSETIYNLLVQYVGTSGTGINTVCFHTRPKNGCKCYLELKGHFKTEA